MRILQLIDSLQVGGAERVAVNFTNALCGKIEFSGIAVTRKEGDLKKFLDTNAKYFFLNKSKTFDFKAIYALKNIIKENKIDFLHAHSTSFFVAFLLKLIYPKIKIIWHDHYGNRKNDIFLRNVMILFCSLFFSKIITVNEELKKWYKSKGFKKTIFLHNFPFLDINFEDSLTVLKGQNDKKILCLANLRPEKNHFLLIEVAKLMKIEFPDWSFHLVGTDYEDEYSYELKLQIDKFDLKENIFFYGPKNDIKQIVLQSKLGVLTSNYEGLPMAFLECASLGLPMIVTEVGQLPEIIKVSEGGFLVKKNDSLAFFEQIKTCILNPDKSLEKAKNVKKYIDDNFSFQRIIYDYIGILENE